MSRLARLVGVEPGEGVLVALLLLHSFAMGVAVVLFETAANGLFLSRFPAEALPFAYITAAVVVPGAGLVYGRLQRRLTPGALWLGALSALLAMFLAVIALVSATTAAWPALLLMALTYVVSAITALEFWGLAGRVLDLRQAKRLYGLVGSGEVAAGIVGGFAVALLLQVMSLVHVLLVASGALLVCLVILARLLATTSFQPQEAQDDDEGEGLAGVARAVLADRYVLLICGLYLFYNFSHDTLDYLQLTQVQARYGASGEEAASFLGVVISVRHLVVLLARTFLSGRLLATFGLGAGLAATPVVVALTGLGLVALSALLPGSAALFWLVIGLKVGERIVYNSLSKPALLVAYRPLAPRRRDRAQLLIETVVEPLSTGLTGVILLGLAAAMAGLTPAGRSVGFALFLTGAALLWFVMARRVRGGYAEVVEGALTRGTLRAVLLRLDEDEVAGLGGWLAKSPPDEVLYLLGVLERSVDPTRLEVVLRGLLDHEDAAVRAAAAEQVERGRLAGLRAEVDLRLEREQAPLARAALLRALAALADADVAPRLQPFLDDPAPAVRRSALVAQLKYGGIPGALVAGERLLQLQRADAPVDRALAAHVLGEVGVPGFYHPLLQLLADPSPEVRAAALDAAGHLRHPRLWPEAAAALALPGLWAPAAAALVRGGPAAVPALAQALAVQGRVGRTRALRALARIASDEAGGPGPAAALLLAQSRTGEGWQRREALAGLSRARHRLPPGSAELEHELALVAARAASLAAALVDLGDEAGPAAAVLRRALEQELLRARDDAYSLLSFRYHVDSVRHVRTQLRGGNPERRTYALEVLDTLCERRHRDVVLPLAEGLEPAALLRRLPTPAPAALGRGPRLVAIARGEPPWSTRWTRAFALAALAGEPGLAATPGALAALAAARSDDDPVLREAAATAPSTEPPTSGETMLKATQKTTLKTIEKVLLLRSVEFFSTVEDDLLAELATSVAEVRFEAGATVIERGKLDSSLFIVGAGEVSVHDEAGAEVARLRARSVFGELAALDPQPRSATIKAVTDTTLLRVDHATLVDLMAEHIEVAHGIIRFLINRYGRPASAAPAAKS